MLCGNYVPGLDPPLIMRPPPSPSTFGQYAPNVAIWGLELAIICLDFHDSKKNSEVTSHPIIPNLAYETFGNHDFLEHTTIHLSTTLPMVCARVRRVQILCRKRGVLIILNLAYRIDNHSVNSDSSPTFLCSSICTFFTCTFFTFHILVCY